MNIFWEGINVIEDPQSREEVLENIRKVHKRLLDAGVEEPLSEAELEKVTDIIWSWYLEGESRDATKH